MVLLTVIVIGLLGLSSIALRSGGRDELAAQARANARIALTAKFIDPIDAADLLTPPTSPLNTAFGHRFEMVSFRWLSPTEI